ncbi:hypothetical protein Tco_0357353 [Tanacetum coccineum]
MAPRPTTQHPGIINSRAPRPPTQQPGFSGRGGLASPGLSSSFSTAMFGGDLFSTSQSISKPSSSSMPTQTASIPPVSSAIVPATCEPQTPAKIDTNLVHWMLLQSNPQHAFLEGVLYRSLSYGAVQRRPKSSTILPSNVLLDETLLSLTGPPNPSCRPAGWGANPGIPLYIM